MKQMKKIISVVATLMVLVLGILLCINATRRQASEVKYKPFMDEPKEIDVLFFGSSHLINGINPMKLWEEQGITSYNMGGHGSPIASSYWMYKNAIEYHKPKVVVLDMYFLESQSKGWDVNLFHTQMDIFPLSDTKIAGIKDIYPEEGKTFELIFPFSIYHNRWKELNIDSYLHAFDKIEASKTKGAEFGYTVAVPNEMQFIEPTETLSQNTVNMSYLTKFIDSCAEEEIEVVLINIPYPATELQQRGANSAFSIAEKYNIPYINYQYENLIDFDTDLYDSDQHVNIAGANKITGHLGGFLKERFSLEDKRKSPEYAHWNEAYKEYLDYLAHEIDMKTEIKSTLMMAMDDCFYIKVYSGAEFEFDDVENKLLERCLADEVSTYEELNSDEKCSLKIQVYRTADSSIVTEKKWNDLRQVVME